MSIRLAVVPLDIRVLGMLINVVCFGTEKLKEECMKKGKELHLHTILSLGLKNADQGKTALMAFPLDYMPVERKRDKVGLPTCPC